jgi:integrase
MRAVDDGDMPTNPFVRFRIRRLRDPNTEKPLPFTKDEIARLATTELGYMWQAWVWCGLRPGEIIALIKDDLDFSKGTIRIERAVRITRVKAPKTAAGTRIVTMQPGFREALGHRELPAEGRIFLNPTTGAPWHGDHAPARAFAKACKAAGVTYRPPKHLRHTFASWALSAGENPMWVAQQMGHEDVQMIFEVYAQWIPAIDPLAGSRMAKAG